MTDGHSRLGRRRRRRECELLQIYDGTSPFAAVMVRQAASLLALLELTTEALNRDPKITLRRVTALQGAYDRQLKALEPFRLKQKPPTIADAIAERERARMGTQ